MYGTDDEFLFKDDGWTTYWVSIGYEMRCSVERAMFKSRLPSLFF